MKAPMISVYKELDHGTRFVLIAAAITLVTRIDEVKPESRVGMDY